MKTMTVFLLIALAMCSDVHAQMVEVFRLAPDVVCTYEYRELRYSWSFSFFTSTTDSGIVEYIVGDSTLAADTLLLWSVRQRRDVVRRISGTGGFDTSFAFKDTVLFQLREARYGLHELRGGEGIWEFERSPAYRVFRFADSSHTRLEWAGGGICHVIPSNYDTLVLSLDSSLSYRKYGLCIDFDDFGWITQHQAQLRSIGILSREDYSLLPSGTKLYQNYPNPFNPTTTISYQLSAVSHVTLKVFDLLGREVATLVDGVKEVGEHSILFDAGKLSSGVYFYQVRAGGYTAIRRMMLLR